jgi:hypothetical protein
MRSYRLYMQRAPHARAHLQQLARRASRSRRRRRVGAVHAGARRGGGTALLVVRLAREIGQLDKHKVELALHLERGLLDLARARLAELGDDAVGEIQALRQSPQGYRSPNCTIRPLL